MSLFIETGLRCWFQGETIIDIGEPQSKLMQVVHGSCTAGDRQGNMYCTIEEDEIFGEISFLLGSTATATVVANEVICSESYAFCRLT